MKGKSSAPPSELQQRSTHDCLCDDDLRRIVEALMERLAEVYAFPPTLASTMRRKDTADTANEEDSNA